MRQARRLLYLVFALFVVMLFKTTTLAADPVSEITYVDYAGEPITTGGTNVTDSTTDTSYTNLNTWLTANSKTAIAYLYDECRSATNPTVFADGNHGSVVKVITSDAVTNGTIGSGVWFILDNKLYITATPSTLGGTVTIDDSGTRSGAVSNTIDFTGTTSEAYLPSFSYTSLDGSDETGIQAPTTGDEIDYETDEWYTYVASDVDRNEIDLGSRSSVSLTGIRAETHSSGTFAPTEAGWLTNAASITDVYFSDDIKLSGNLNGFFNDSFASYVRWGGDIAESKYTSLKNVYLYSDMTQVTGAAGMFARCPELENIYVRGGETAPVKKLNNAESTAYMFYGDTKLINDGETSFINAMDLSEDPALVSTAYMFAGCEAISQPSVSNYNMANVKWANCMFYGAKNAGLVSDSSSNEPYNIYTWNLSSVIDASCMFSGGDADGVFDPLEPTSNMDAGLDDISSYGNVITGTVDMTNWDMTACKLMYMMYSRNGENFIGVIFDDAYAALEDASGMFLRCDYLRNASMHGTSMPSLKNATMMFKLAGSKYGASEADINGWSAPSLINADLMFYGTGFRKIDTTGISDLSNVTNAALMFGNNKNLTSLGDGALGSVTFAALTDAYALFIDCPSLVMIDTSNFNFSNVEDISFMLQNTSSLTAGVDVLGWGISDKCVNAECFAQNSAISSFDVSGWNASKVRSFAFAFADNENLTQVTTGNGLSLSAATTIFGMFADCPSLQEVGTLSGGKYLVDAGGVFANDKTLTSVSISNIVDSSVKYIDYFMKNCSAIASVDVSGWNTAGVIYAQGAFDGCNGLSTLTTGSKLSFASCIDAGTLLRNCYKLNSAQTKKVLDGFGTSTGLVDIYEIVKNMYALTTLDMSGMNLSSVTEYRRIARMDENGSFTTNKLVNIIVPSSILSSSDAVTKDETGKSLNMFWVDGDGKADGDEEESTSTDDLLTSLYVDGTPSAKFLAYNFGGDNGDNDNRSFVIFNSRTINGNGVGTYNLTDATDTALMKLDATSTFYTDGTDSSAKLVPLTYTWTKNASSIAGADEASYETMTSGNYVAKASPSLLTGSNSYKTASFIIGADVVGITAKYKGGEITVGSDYSKSDVTVSILDADGNEIPITADDWTVNSTKVTKVGTNTYTVTYSSGTDKYTATFEVPGVRHIGSVVATYSGPSVLVGKDYDTQYVTLTAYYADDTSKKEGFAVSPTSFSATKVSSVGDNTFTANYTDKEQEKTFSSNFIVNGYKAITSISATYTGDKIKVGEKYNKDDVKVTLYYSDGSGSSTTSNFSVDSQTVTYEGGNSFTASYRDPFGNIYSAGFSVTGYKDAASTAASNAANTPSNATGVTTSTVSPPTSTSDVAASNVQTGTSTGVVQTGRTVKTLLYIFAFICLSALVAVAIIQRRKQGK